MITQIKYESEKMFYEMCFDLTSVENPRGWQRCGHVDFRSLFTKVQLESFETQIKI